MKKEKTTMPAFLRSSPRILATLLAMTALVLPVASRAQDIPPYASAPAQSQDQQIHGRIESIDGTFNLTVRDDNGYLDNIQMRQGTIINPTGLTLSGGMVVTVIGYPSGQFFNAVEIDTPYSYSGPAPTPVYYGAGWWYPGFAYGYGPSFSLGIVIGFGGGYSCYQQPWAGHWYGSSAPWGYHNGGYGYNGYHNGNGYNGNGNGNGYHNGNGNGNGYNGNGNNGSGTGNNAYHNGGTTTGYAPTTKGDENGASGHETDGSHVTPTAPHEFAPGQTVNPGAAYHGTGYGNTGYGSTGYGSTAPAKGTPYTGGQAYHAPYSGTSTYGGASAYGGAAYRAPAGGGYRSAPAGGYRAPSGGGSAVRGGGGGGAHAGGGGAHR